MPKKAKMKKTVKVAKKFKASAMNVVSPIVGEQTFVPQSTGTNSITLLDLESFKDTEITPNMEAFLELGHTIYACKPKPQPYIRVKDDPEWKNRIVTLRR